MKLAAFNATCPFEIGDKIKSRRRVKPGEAERSDLTRRRLSKRSTRSPTLCAYIA